MKVIVIGGGAAGMMAALTAARGGAEVCVLERQPRVGRKLLATGNGRCNLTNLDLKLKFYHGKDVSFAKSALTAFDSEKTLAFFEELGLITTSEAGGRVYPLSDQAGSVVDVLRLALEEANVLVRTDFTVTAIRPGRHGFRVSSGEETLQADRVIICCGGMAGGKLGGTQSGYELLKSLGHTMTKLYPALVQIKTDNTFVRALKGVRADGAVTVKKGDKTIAKSEGEIQFTDFGVSGPAMFEVSRAVSGTKGELVLHLDLMRSKSYEEMIALLEKRRAAMPGQTMENFLTGMLHNRLGRTLLRYVGYGLTDPIRDLTQSDCRRVASAIKDFAIPVIGALGFDGAQVTAGGISTDEFDPETLESYLIPGLYAAGEVLDIDGDCGGYNLQWAWASGHLAGEHAALQ